MGYELNGQKFKEWQNNNPELEKQRIEKIRNALKGKKFSLEHRKKLSIAKKKLVESGWQPWQKGKKSKKARMYKEGMVCQNCNSKRYVEKHHKDFKHYNDNPENVVMLCRSCHESIHRKERWNRGLVKPIRDEKGKFKTLDYKEEKMSLEISDLVRGE